MYDSFAKGHDAVHVLCSIDDVSGLDFKAINYLYSAGSYFARP